jgi:hypothetical protein
MLANRPVQMGFAPAVAAAAIWPWVVRLGTPLLVGAGLIYASSSLVKAAVPSIPINTRNVPQAALLGGFGIASYYASSLLPEKWAPLGYIGAALGVAGSIYMLFKDASFAGPADEGPTPAASEQAYKNIKAIIDYPKLNQQLGLNFPSDNYTIKMVWLNDGPEGVSFNYRFTVTEVPTGVFGTGAKQTYNIQPTSSAPEIKPINKISLLPKDSLPVEYSVPIKNHVTGWVANNVDLKVEVFNPHAKGWMPIASQSFVVRRV